MEISVCCLSNNFGICLIVCKVMRSDIRSFVVDMVIVICKVIAVYLNCIDTVVCDLLTMICIANFGYPLLNNSYFVVSGYRWNLCDIEKIYYLCQMICKYCV